MISILGCKLDDIDADEATARILEFAQGSSCAQVVTLGTEMVVLAQRDATFRNIVNAAALSLCDTIGLLLVARRHGSQLQTRVTGVELIDQLCARAPARSVGIFFLGGAPGIATKAAAELQKRYPALEVCGTQHGFFQEDESESIAAAVRASGAKVLFVGLGSPRQEVWIKNHASATGCGAAIGVGGSFDVISGTVQRAPAVWRRFGAEWLYRLVREPRRWRRQLALPYFVWLVATDSLRGTRRRTANL